MLDVANTSDFQAFDVRFKLLGDSALFTYDIAEDEGQWMGSSSPIEGWVAASETEMVVAYRCDESEIVGCRKVEVPFDPPSRGDDDLGSEEQHLAWAHVARLIAYIVSDFEYPGP